jgi:hypothetical protein
MNLMHTKVDYHRVEKKYEIRNQREKLSWQKYVSERLLEFHFFIEISAAILCQKSLKI